MSSRTRNTLIGLAAALALAGLTAGQSPSDKDKKNLAKAVVEQDKAVVEQGKKVVAADMKLVQTLTDPSVAGRSYRVWTITILDASSVVAGYCTPDVPWQYVYAGSSADITQNDQVRFKAELNNHTYQILFPGGSPLAAGPINIPAGGTSDPVAVNIDPSRVCAINGRCTYPYTITDTTGGGMNVCNNHNTPGVGTDGLVVHGGT